MTRRCWALPLAVALASACGLGGDEAPPSGGRLRAAVVRPLADTLRDTVRFATTAEAAQCDSGRGLVLDGVVGGNGVLVWVRPGDSTVAGEYTYATRLDSASRRSAVVAVRFVASDVSRGVTLDSGRLDVTERGGALSATARGSGLAYPGATRVAVEVDVLDVPIPRDTVSCARAP
ncbi:MAG TPA: hypothetical protein VGA20_02730 [Gemmatimonadales bacterium]